MSNRLSRATLGELSSNVEGRGFNPDDVSIGIVHFGLGLSTVRTKPFTPMMC